MLSPSTRAAGGSGFDFAEVQPLRTAAKAKIGTRANSFMWVLECERVPREGRPLTHHSNHRRARDVCADPRFEWRNLLAGMKPALPEILRSLCFSFFDDVQGGP